ncbi:Metallo-dependent phosphatase-like protein [Mycena sanguinolenta]|nr:Metallo-dependent phosphatase-like protein [Mycena sanguinolenta]
MPTIALPHRTSIASPTSVVQLEYPESGAGPLPKPDSATGHWTRFVLLSDTHTKRCDVPAGDVLLHSGDLTQRGSLDELKSTMEWLYALPHPVKIIMAGNHDEIVDRQWYETKWERDSHSVPRLKDGSLVPAQAVFELLKGPKAVAANIVYLEGEEYRFKVRDGGKEWSVYGSPLSPYWGDWAFGYEKEDAEDVVSKFPKTDILLTHGPPHNILDLTINKERAGCHALSAAVPKLKPRLHVFGHIHEARGAYIHRWSGKHASELPPRVQNAIQLGAVGPGIEYGSEDDEPHRSDSDEDSLKSEKNGSDDGKIVFEGEEETELPVGDEAVEETIFVNAANMPMGRNALRDGRRVKMGGIGFQPIVVDFLEEDA